jgi:hypothetical protein
MPPALFSH